MIKKLQPQTSFKLRTTTIVFSKTQIQANISINSLDSDITHCKGSKSYLSAMPAAKKKKKNVKYLTKQMSTTFSAWTTDSESPTQ